MDRYLMVGLLALSACHTTPAASDPTNTSAGAAKAMVPAVAVEHGADTSSDASSESAPLRTVLLVGRMTQMSDCGHDGALGDLHCAYGDDGSARPAPASQTLRVFITDPPGMILASSSWHPANKVGRDAVVAAECQFDQHSRVQGLRLAATEGVPGWWYDGSLAVGVLSDCAFAPSSAIPKQLRAAHLLVSHKDAKRPPAGVTRASSEALAIARAAATQLLGGAAFEEVVRAVSDEKATANRGGSLGTFSLRVMAPEFSLVLLATKPGAQSPVFETGFGFHILERR